MSEPRRYWVYILSNPSRTLYIGVTSNLQRRIWQHRQKVIDGFTRRYNITMLVYFEEFSDPRAAVARERSLKGWRRDRKLALVLSVNPNWLDLAAEWFEEAVQGS